VWYGIIDAISNYNTCPGHESEFEAVGCRLCDNWQFKEIAKIFRPICYLTGKCEFNSVMDRACSIRGRVTANAEKGRPSSEWADPMGGLSQSPVAAAEGVVRDVTTGAVVAIFPIDPAEWLNDPMAAR
jgi:hypothetical protein